MTRRAVDPRRGGVGLFGVVDEDREGAPDVFTVRNAGVDDGADDGSKGRR